MLTMAYRTASILVWTTIPSYPMPQEPPNLEKAVALMELTQTLSRTIPQLPGNSVLEVEIMTLFLRPVLSQPTKPIVALRAVLGQPTKLVFAPRSDVGQSPRPRRPTLEFKLPRTQPVLTQSYTNLSRRCLLPLGPVPPASQGHPRGRVEGTPESYQELLNLNQ